jgi:ParB family chromosome partitioning protein
MRHDLHFVEQLTSREGAPIGRMIPIERLDLNLEQPRVEIGDLADLVGSIAEKGILEPLLVRPSHLSGRFMIISGERRYRAATIVGLREVPCIEMDVDDRAVAEICLIENLQRKDLTPYEEAQGLKALVDRFGYTHEEIAKKIGKSRSSVTEALAISELPEEVKELCRHADIQSKSILLQIVRQKDPEIMRAMIERISRQGLKRDEIRRERKTLRKKAGPFVYRYRTQEFALELKFKKSEVTKEYLATCLRLVAELVESP